MVNEDADIDEQIHDLDKRVTVMESTLEKIEWGVKVILATVIVEFVGVLLLVAAKAVGS